MALVNFGGAWIWVKSVFMWTEANMLYATATVLLLRRELAWLDVITGKVPLFMKPEDIDIICILVHTGCASLKLYTC